MKTRMLMLTAGWLALCAGVANSAIPNTSDYQHKTMPMISGTVFSVDDQQLVVDTDQGQRVTLVMDSHTMLPTDLAPGMVMRAEFRVMENGQYYANRITPIRGATRASGAESSGNAGSSAAEPATAVTPSAAATSAADETPPAAETPAAAKPSPASQRPDTLPQTASPQPLFALLGLLALGGAGALRLARRPSRA